MPAPDRLPVNDLARAWLATADDVRDAVASVLASGWYVQGPQHDAFEHELAEFLGVRHVVGVASGTDALALALQAAAGGSRGEIVTVANAGGYVSAAAAQVGCRVVYADVDPISLTATAASIEPALGPSTTAVVVTHLYGNLVDTRPIAELCRSRGIRLIEDCAQAAGARLGDTRVGGLGDLAAFSFYPTKNLGAAGDGGAVATNDPELAQHVRSLRQYGWGQRYRIEQPGGRNSRLDEIQAAILRRGLGRVDSANARRTEIVARYAEAVAGGRVRMVTGAGTTTVAHLAVVRTDRRDELRARLEAAAIATDIHYPIPDHRQPGLPAPDRETSLAVTELAVSQILTIPCFPDMTDDELERVERVLRSAG